MPLARYRRTQPNQGETPKCGWAGHRQRRWVVFACADTDAPSDRHDDRMSTAKYFLYQTVWWQHTPRMICKRRSMDDGEYQLIVGHGTRGLKKVGH